MEKPKFDLDYINRLISENIQESTHLDYKAAAALDRSKDPKYEITKDVSALANSDGGVIIYGIREKRDPKYSPDAIDAIDLKRSKISREWLDQIIGQISPRPQFTIHPIVVDENQGHVFVIEVEKSTTVHQALDCKYYRRRNFESSAMEDYEVREAMFRDREPKLDVDLTVHRNNHFVDSTEAYFTLWIRNSGTVMARFYRIDLAVKATHIGNLEKASDGICPYYSGQIWTNSTGNDAGAPLFPGETKSVRFNITGLMIEEVNKWVDYQPPLFKYSVFADNAPCKVFEKRCSLALYDPSDVG